MKKIVPVFFHQPGLIWQESQSVNTFDSDNPIQEEPNNAQRPANPLREITSSSLLQGEKEILILHGEEVYRLKLTRNGKLILQK